MLSDYMLLACTGSMRFSRYDTGAMTTAHRQADLEAKIDALKQKKASMKEDAYYAELETLLVSLARLAREIRQVEGR